VIGTLVNVVAIVAGTIIGRRVVRDLSPDRQQLLKKLLGVFTVYVGLSMTWSGLSGSLGSILRQLLVVVIALMLGNLTGHSLGIQRRLNRLGRYAREQFAAAQSPTVAEPRFADGFLTCTILFCVGPMAILGALQDGLQDNIRTLAIKSVMDGLAAVVFARSFGWSVALSALPVLAYQGTLTLLARYFAPVLMDRSLLDAISATGGLLVFTVALVILELRRIELADYLPSLVYAPLLTWFGRWMRLWS
jgi:uncharacterized protein